MSPRHTRAGSLKHPMSLLLPAGDQPEQQPDPGTSVGDEPEMHSGRYPARGLREEVSSAALPRCHISRKQLSRRARRGRRSASRVLG